MKLLTYLESQDSNYQNILANQPTSSETTIMIAFANFEFDAQATIGGMVLTKEQLQAAIKEIQSKGGKALLSFGGTENSYYVSQSNEWPDTNAIASSIVAIIEGYGFDGCDLNIQEWQPTNTFATQVLTIIKNIRQTLPGAMITLTIPGQTWNLYWESLSIRAHPYLDTINFMEYNLWINKDYLSQIQADVNHYRNLWGIPANKISIGILPGLDKQGRNMTLEMTQFLTNWAKEQSFYGMMIWNMNRDFNGVEGNKSFAFTNVIISTNI